MSSKAALNGYSLKQLELPDMAKAWLILIIVGTRNHADSIVSKYGLFAHRSTYIASTQDNIEGRQTKN